MPAGIAVIKNGVPILTILPPRLSRKTDEALGSSEEAIALAVSALVSFSSVIINALGAEPRIIETENSRIYVLKLSEDTYVLLFIPGRLEVSDEILEAIEEAVKNISDPKELEERLKSLLSAIDKPEAELSRGVIEDLVEILLEEDFRDIKNVYRIAISLLSPEGLPTAEFLEPSKIYCIEKPPEISTANAVEVFERISSAKIRAEEARILREIPIEPRKFSGGNVLRVPSKDIEKITYCIRSLKSRKKLLKYFLSDYPKHLAEYINRRPEEIKAELEKRRSYLDKLYARLESERKRVEEEIFSGIFEEEAERAKDLYKHIIYRIEQIKEILDRFPKEPREGLSNFKSRLRDLYTRLLDIESVLSPLGADVSSMKEQILSLEDGIKRKEEAHNKALEAALSRHKERIKNVESLIRSLEEEISRIEEIKDVRLKLYKSAAKKASSLLKSIDKALSEIEPIPYTSIAIITYAFEHDEGIEIYVPKEFKKYKETLEKLSRYALTKSKEPIPKEVIREAVNRALSKASKRKAKKLSKAFSSFLLRPLPRSSHARPYFLSS